jgi:hypothetical protein
MSIDRLAVTRPRSCGVGAWLILSKVLVAVRGSSKGIAGKGNTCGQFDQRGWA